MLDGGSSPPLRSQIRAALRRTRVVDRPGLTVDHDSVVVPGRLDTDKIVLEVPLHARRFALERIAPPPEPGLFMAEDVALLHRHGQLPGQRLRGWPRVQHVVSWPAAPSPVE